MSERGFSRLYESRMNHVIITLTENNNNNRKGNSANFLRGQNIDTQGSNPDKNVNS
ncbi:hypothetical protein Bpfe_015748, partial [Biomphalaria pfeifferi]